MAGLNIKLGLFTSAAFDTRSAKRLTAINSGTCAESVHSRISHSLAVPRLGADFVSLLNRKFSLPLPPPGEKFPIARLIEMRIARGWSCARAMRAEARAEAVSPVKISLSRRSKPLTPVYAGSSRFMRDLRDYFAITATLPAYSEAGW